MHKTSPGILFICFGKEESVSKTESVLVLQPESVDLRGDDGLSFGGEKYKERRFALSRRKKKSDREKVRLLADLMGSSCRRFVLSFIVRSPTDRLAVRQINRLVWEAQVYWYRFFVSSF